MGIRKDVEAASTTAITEVMGQTFKPEAISIAMDTSNTVAATFEITPVSSAVRMKMLIITPRGPRSPKKLTIWSAIIMAIVDIAFFVGTIIAGQLPSYAILSGKITVGSKTWLALLAIFLLALAFVIFSFYPPKLSLFEHSTLENNGKYGILHHYHD